MLTTAIEISIDLFKNRLSRIKRSLGLVLFPSLVNTSSVATNIRTQYVEKEIESKNKVDLLAPQVGFDRGGGRACPGAVGASACVLH